MEINKCTMPAFSVIGKEGSTEDGVDFIDKLWNDANSHFDDVASLAAMDENGNLLGIWGLMSDFTHSFKPWQNNFTEGLYLAGIQAKEDADAPEGWIKWNVPSFEYLFCKVEQNYQDTFSSVIDYMKDNSISLAGAVFDYNCPIEKQLYLFFPIRKISVDE